MGLDIKARLGLDGKGFAAGAERAKQTANKMKANIVGAFKGVAVGLAAMFAGSALKEQLTFVSDYAAKVRDLANTFGISTEAVQKFDYAATQAGIELQTVMDGMKDLGKNTSEALMGVEGKIWAFKQLGISVAEIKGKNIDQIFMRVAKAIQESGPILEPNQVKAIEDLMGGAGFQSINMMRGDLEEVFKQLEKMGGIIDEKAINKLGALSDKFAAFKTMNKSTFADLFSFIGDKFMFMINVMSSKFEIFTERMKAAAKMAKALGAGDWSAAGQHSLDFMGMEKATMSAVEAKAAKGKTGGWRAAGGILGGMMGGLWNMGGMNPLAWGEAVNRATVKGAALDAHAAGAEKAPAGEQNLEAIKGNMLERKRIAEEVAAIEERAEKRRYDSLTTAQKLVELELKRAEARKKLQSLGTFLNENELKTQASILAHLRETKATGGKELEAEMKMLEGEETAKLEAKNLEIMKAREAILGMNKEGQALREGQIIPEKTMVGENKFGSLARIGGQIGAKNPVLDTAKKQLKLTEEIKKNSAATAGALGVIAGTQGAP
jgi:hypothetical protein